MPAPVTVTAAADPGTQPRSGLLIGVLVVSAFVMILNETILSVALRTLTVELHVATTTIQWLTSGFLLTMAVVIPTTGFLLERCTPRQVFLASLTVFSVGTLINALAPGFGVLLVGRVVQACGTAVMLPLLMTSVMRLVPPARRGATMGTITIVIAVAPAIGPTIGGAVLSSLGWRWMFWIVLPIALVALAVGLRWLRIAAQPRRVPLDLLSVLLSALAFGGLVFGLSGVGEAARGEALVNPWLPTAVGVAAMAVFVHRQLRLQRDGRALLDLRPLAFRPFLVSVVLVVLSMMSLFGALILLPLYLQDVLHVNAFVTGLAVLPGGLVMGLLGPVIGRRYDKIGARPLVIPGAVVLAGVLWAFTTLSASSPLWTVIAMHVVLVVGLSLMLTPLVTAVTKIALEHVEYLGSDLKGIAREKAGIAKPKVPFVTGEADPEIRAELVKEAKRRGAAPIIAVDTTLRPRKTTKLGLQGRHQIANALVAHAILKALPKPFGPVGKNLPASFATAYIPGRFETRGKWIFDVAHNPDGMTVVAEAIREGWQTIKRPLHALVGIRNDKDWRGMLRILEPVVDRLVLTVPPSIPVMQRWSLEDLDALAHFDPDFTRALEDIQQGAGSVLVTGSFHTVGDAMARLPGFAPVG